MFDNKNNGNDDFGPLEIPDKESFFYLLSKDSLFILSARRNDI